jgi:asparagine synthase (glutamine-hydrolysing)
MCGITGIFDLSGRRGVDPQVLLHAAAMLRHRGPDQCGLYVDDRVGLAHNRLSIIDLAGGGQPLANEDESVWIVYNGEVFNYPELRHELLSRGHRFRTATDTEVIVHLYEEAGEHCVEALNGQFAFAIWDTRRARLMLARDRVGILPLHYTEHEQRLLFASEIKALLAVPGISARLDPLSLAQISTLWTTLPGRTAFTGIRELPAGHLLLASERGVQLRRYFSLPFCGRAGHLDEPANRIAERVAGLLEDAVRIRLRADVPVGTYVSGGLDSSAITALVAKRFNADVATFGLRFEDPAFDEGPSQRQVVDYLHTSHREVVAGARMIADAFLETLWHVERPLLRTAPVPLLLLSRLVRQSGLKVVLTGEGADELFGGYNIFRETLVRRFWARRPDSPLARLAAQQLYGDIFRERRGKLLLATFLGKYLTNGDDPFFSHRVRWETTGRIQALFSPALAAAIGDYDPLPQLLASLPAGFSGWDALSKAQYLETELFLSNYLLGCQGDRVAMANSVEVRVPFLDHRLIELSCRIPSVWKILGLREKHILRQAVRELLPPAIISREKFAYRAPVARAMLETLSNPLSRELLSEAALKRSGLFDPAKVTHFVKRVETQGAAGETDSMALALIVSSMAVERLFVADFAGRRAPPVSKLDVFVDRRSAAALFASPLAAMSASPGEDCRDGSV